MALGMSPLDETKEKQDNQDYDDDHDDDDVESDDDHDDDDNNEEHNEVHNLKDVIVSNQIMISSNNNINPPVQLDLLPSAPVLRHTSFPWSSDNGSDGGPSGPAEEATSSFRLEFMSYGGNGNSESHKRGFEMGNDAVLVERGSSRVSDEDEHGLILSRKKLRLSKEQSAYLEESFKEHSTLNPKQKLTLAEQLNLRPRQVEVWFQNRRARTKLKQTEVDFEYLKRCCETLTDENRRLHKELQELRALKTTTNPFYMQLPATTLTMCPSCERVATTSNTVHPPSTTATTSTKHVEQQKISNAPLNVSPKPTSLIFKVSSTNS
ncbi:hypothetical protein QVD17_35130 [Tagetes erecta]|uniref:Homeobox domain-containing protein n=1 Tax=Tagetes erecta TaxID=13708 RepID=A0AAD8NMA6_TARER|nr:hypothetical protein QVD17_35130 [Tagetes erecta]